MSKTMINRLTFLALLHDVVAAVFAWWFAYMLRFNFELPDHFVSIVWETASWVIPLQAAIFILSGLYQGVWRFASIPDLYRILKALIFSAVVVAAVMFMFQPDGVVVPRTVLIADPLLLLVLMAGSRFSYRVWKEHRLYGFAGKQRKPVIVVGTGLPAVSLVKDLLRSGEWRVVGILDEDTIMHGRQIHGIQVLGGIDRLPEIAARLSVRNVIVAMPSVAHEARKRTVHIANQCGLEVLTVPSFEDLMSGKVTISELRPIEVEDLLGRDPVTLDAAALYGLLEAKTVMVTGAGGSIGAELCRQIARFKPAMLICYDISEFALYQLEQEFAGASADVELVYIVGDIRNELRLQGLLSRCRPSTVFHAAAYKHVPLMEHENVGEALSNNVFGTYVLAHACKQAGVGQFVLVSTDKAVNPTNVMGASKRLAEMVCQGLQEANSTRFVIVRFGNVLGSSGSVIPKFREQIAKGGPITVTHPEITRFFMSIPEAAQLVMQAGVMGTGAEIFVMDMGEPVRIADLARDMIRLSGLREDDIRIEYTGLRPGEKLYEELLAHDELTLQTPHPKLRVVIARTADSVWVANLIEWVEGAVNREENTIKAELRLWLEEYTGDVNREQQSADLTLTSSRMD